LAFWSKVRIANSSASCQVNPRLSLRANFTWTFWGNVIYAGCQWGMLVILAKLGSQEMVGQFALGFAVTAPVMMFASLRIREVQATDAEREYSFGDYLGLRLITTVLALLVVVVILLIAGYDRETRLVVLAVGIAKSFESISDVYYGLLQKQERMDLIARSLMIKGPLSLAILGITVYLTGSVFWGTLALSASWGLVLLSYDIHNAGRILKSIPQLPDTLSGQGRQAAALRPCWEKTTLTRLAWLALPLGFVELLSSLNANIPRYFVERCMGASLLGIFAALGYFDRAGNLVAHALGQSVSPRLAQYYAAKNSAAFRKLLLKLVGIGLLLGGTGVLVAQIAGDMIVSWFYRPEYVRHDVFVALMAAAGMGYLAKFLVYALTAARRFRVLMVLGLSVTAILVVLCIFLIPSGGLHGAALALVGARGVEVAGALAASMLVLLALQSAARRQ
jgi:O-antigen/teichoic acid export membrane protein